MRLQAGCSNDKEPIDAIAYSKSVALQATLPQDTYVLTVTYPSSGPPKVASGMISAVSYMCTDIATSCNHISRRAECGDVIYGISDSIPITPSNGDLMWVIKFDLEQAGKI